MADVRQYETDIAIVGAGGAGVAAGIEARDAGARVIAFEQGPELGGAAIISGGGCLIVGSPLQKANGIHDTPDLAFKDWIAWGGPSADAVWARYYIEHTLHDPRTVHDQRRVLDRGASIANDEPRTFEYRDAARRRLRVRGSGEGGKNGKGNDCCGSGCIHSTHRSLPK